jgi:hypothetical protein
MIKKTLVGLIAMAGMLVSPAAQATIIPWSATINSGAGSSDLRLLGDGFRFRDY